MRAVRTLGAIVLACAVMAPAAASATHPLTVSFDDVVIS